MAKNKKKTWTRLHVDYAGSKNDWCYLVIDSFSKWSQVVKSSRATTTDTIMILQELFARFRNPDTIVTDYVTPLTATEFRKIMDRANRRICNNTTISPEIKWMFKKNCRYF